MRRSPYFSIWLYYYLLLLLLLPYCREPKSKKRGFWGWGFLFLEQRKIVRAGGKIYRLVLYIDTYHEKRRKLSFFF